MFKIHNTKHIVKFSLTNSNLDDTITMNRTEQKALASSQFSLLLCRDFESTVLLHKAGVSMKQVDAFGSQPLHLAVRRGDLEVAIALIICQSDVDAKGENGWWVILNSELKHKVRT